MSIGKIVGNVVMKLAKTNGKVNLVRTSVKSLKVPKKYFKNAPLLQDFQPKKIATLKVNTKFLDEDPMRSVIKDFFAQTGYTEVSLGKLINTLS